jgi:tripartite-type tricarboxylate transporter receptor subunit TctC
VKPCAAVVALPIACWVGTVQAQGADPGRYPVRPIRIVVPFGPGGPSDILSRAVGQKLSETFGQQVIIDNRGGAAGVVGSELVAKSPPDGYTLVSGTTGTHGINASTFPRLPYDTVRDFAPIARLGVSNYVLVVHPSVPARTVKDLLQLAKHRPGQLTWAAGGGVTQLAAELFKRMAGIDVVVVAYKGNGPAVTATMSGEVSAIFGGIAQSLSIIESGRLRAIAVSGLRRSGALPSVPTVAESGLEGYEAGSWYGLLAPAATPRPIVEQLNREILRVLQMPDIRARLTREAFDIPNDTPEQFAAHIRADVPKWARIVKEAGIKPE